MRVLPSTTLLSVVLAAVTVAGQNAAPSSHMVYNDASFDGDILINEVRVPKDGVAMYTYYEALGWGGKAAGYAGIQEHPRARNYIFSIWDHKEHTAPIKPVYRGPGTETTKFGGEGTGLKSWNFELGWDTDVWYTLVARCWPAGDHTFYGYWVRNGKTEQWTHMVTMDVAVKDAYLRGGNDSFIEDWLETGKNPRTIHLRNGWKRKPLGEWHAFGSARYSVNSWDLTPGERSFNYKTNWDGGTARDGTGEYYYMVAGGAATTPSSTNPSTHSIARIGEKPGYTPIKVLSAEASLAANGRVAVSWKPDPTSLPQFGYQLRAFGNPEATGEPITTLSKTEPHARSTELPLPKGVKPSGIHLRLVCVDILGNESVAVPVRFR